MSSTERTECHRVVDLIHRVLDGDLIEAAEHRLLGQHLGDCYACRQVESELREVHEALRALPSIPLPDAALQDVFARTSRSGRLSRLRQWGLDWRTAAAAASLALAMLLGMWIRGPVNQPSQAEIDQATAEARMVFKLTAEALQRTQRAADDVLTDEVSTALRRVPMKLPRTVRRSADKDNQI